MKGSGKYQKLNRTLYPENTNTAIILGAASGHCRTRDDRITVYGALFHFFPLRLEKGIRFALRLMSFCILPDVRINPLRIAEIPIRHYFLAAPCIELSQNVLTVGRQPARYRAKPSAGPQKTRHPPPAPCPARRQQAPAPSRLNPVTGGQFHGVEHGRNCAIITFTSFLMRFS